MLCGFVIVRVAALRIFVPSSIMFFLEAYVLVLCRCACQGQRYGEVFSCGWTWGLAKSPQGVPRLSFSSYRPRLPRLAELALHH
jgi:hypothetical protein